MIVRLHDLMDGAQTERLVAAMAPAAMLGEAAITGETAAAHGREMADALIGHPTIEAASMPRHIADFAFMRITRDMAWERPIDATVVRVPDRDPVRADLLLTLFLSDPEDYGGGELVIIAETGTQLIKPAAGDAVIYPATNYHRVETVTGGERWTAETAIQSTVRDDEQRKILTELATVLDWIGGAPTDAAERLAPSARALRRARANLHRMWADI